MPRKRWSSNWALPLVVKLNSRLPVTAAAVMTANARASWRGSSSTLVRLLRRAGGSSSAGHTRMNSRPHAIDSSPGTAKAARHPSHWTSTPVTSAARATPRLPASPLTPMTAPGLVACCTIMGMPTGW
ncbi:Uncharacterised protein [Bordetella pertussis]|nr:Uncharacterised protein [Bordetella pertussis]